MEATTGFDAWTSVLGCVGTLMLVLIGFLNWSIFWKQLTLALEQIATSARQLEIARKAPDLQLIGRVIEESSDHVKLLVDRPYLRPYLYDGVTWKDGDRASADEVKLMAEMVLNSFASTPMHPAAFPQHPVRGMFERERGRDPIRFAALTMQQRQ